MKQPFTKPHLTQIIALTVTLLPEGQRILAGCMLRKKSDTIIIEHHWPELTGIEELRLLSIESDVPLVLTLEGRGILHKEFSKLVPLPATAPDLLALILPGAVASDFFLQRNIGVANQYITLIRHATVEDIINDFLEQQWYAISIEAGPFSLPKLVPFLETEWLDTTAQVGHYIVTLQGGEIAEISATATSEVSSATYRVGEQELTDQTILAYAAGVRMLLGDDEASLATELTEKIKDEWQQKKLFRLRGAALLGLFLIVLLANFLIFNQLSAKNQKVIARMAHSEQEIKTLATLRQTVQRQQDFLQSAGWLNPTSQSIYADQLAASVPTGLQLTQVELNPLDEALTRQQQETIFVQNTVIVRGKCKEAQTLNDWLQKLNRLPWIKKIQQQNFAYDYGAGTGTFSFTIQLHNAS